MSLLLIFCAFSLQSEILTPHHRLKNNNKDILKEKNPEKFKKKRIPKHHPHHEYKDEIYTGSKTFFARYNYENTEMLHVTWETNRFVLNTHRDPSIQKTTCDKNQVVLEYKDKAKRKLAFEKLEKENQEKELILFVPHGLGGECGDTHSRMIKSVSTLNDDKISIQTTEDKLSDTLNGKFKIEVEPIETRKKRGTTKKFEADYNFNYKDGKVAKESISLLESEFADLNCIDCYAHVDVKAEATFYGWWIFFTHYEASLTYEVDANLGLDLVLKKNTNNHRIKLLKDPITPFVVPGFFKLGPEASLDIVLDIDVTEQTELKVDFEYKNQQTIHFKTDGPTIFQRPKFNVENGRPNPFSYKHEIKKRKASTVRVCAFLKPDLALTLEIFGFKLIDLYVDIRAGVLLSVEQVSSCKQLGVQLTPELIVDFGMKFIGISLHDGKIAEVDYNKELFCFNQIEPETEKQKEEPEPETSEEETEPELEPKKKERIAPAA